jgi:hypothetical protein
VSFQDANRDALPESLDFRRARQTTLQERLLQIERELAGLRDQRDRLVAFYNRTGRVEMAADAATPEQRRLRDEHLQAQAVELVDVRARRERGVEIGHGGRALAARRVIDDDPPGDEVSVVA